MFGFIFNLISGALPFCLTIIVGGYLTVKTNLFQTKNFFRSFTAVKQGETGGISGFSAMCNSLSAALGTGNIVGVAAAISLGGAGAVFWMWISAFFSMIIKSGEIALGVFYREKHNEKYVGGTHFYIKNALPECFKKLALIYAFSGLSATFFCGNMTQINSAVSSFSNNDIIKIIIGAFSAVAVYFIIIGGGQKIAKFLSGLLPFMAVAYFLLCIGVILRNINLLPSAFKSIFIGAFSPKAATGGAVGSILTTISVGASKGIFSNEAGVGTAAIAHSAVKNAKPREESLYGIFEVFIDTTVLCTLTALTILTSGVIIDCNSTTAYSLTSAAMQTLYGDAAVYILSAMLWLFGISSVIGWATYGISFSGFLFGSAGERVFTVVYPLFCAVGVLLPQNFIWKIAELLNGLLVIINLFVMTYLSKKLVKLLKEK